MLSTIIILGLASLLVLYMGYEIKFKKRVDLINLYDRKDKIKDVDALCEFVGNHLIILAISILAMALFINSNIIVNLITIFILAITFNATYGIYYSGKYLE